MNRVTVLLALAGGVAACSPVMEAYRPDPVDLAQFKVGEPRLDVLKALGPPSASAKDGPNSCDLYQLYIHGPDSGGKAAIAAGEAVADVFTIGLAEVIFTPTEVATKNSKYSVTMCYDPDEKLAAIQAMDKPLGETQQPAQAPAPPGSPPNAAPPAATAASTTPPGAP
jgi:hypothetical protein